MCTYVRACVRVCVFVYVYTCEYIHNTYNYRYLKLEKEGQSLITLCNNERLLHLMKKLKQFEELNVATVSHLKARVTVH